MIGLLEYSDDYILGLDKNINVIYQNEVALKDFNKITSLDKLLSKKDYELFKIKFKTLKSRNPYFELDIDLLNNNIDQSKIICTLSQEKSKSHAYLMIKKIEKTIELKEKLNFQLSLEKIVFEISQALIATEPNSLNHTIEDMLRKIGEFSNIDRSYLFLFSDNYKTMSNTHEWCKYGIEPQINQLQNISSDLFPWWTKKLLKFENIYLESLSDLPVEAYKEKEILASQNIKSLLVVPLSTEHTLIGFLGFDSVTNKKTWSKNTISLLSIVSSLVASAIVRDNLTAEKNKVMKLYQKVFETTSSPTIILSSDAKIIKSNKPFDDIICMTKKEKNTPFKWLEHVYVEDQDKVINIRAMRLSKEEKAPKNYQLRLVSCKGMIRHFLVVADLIENTQNTILSFTDVTSLVESNHKLESLLDETVNVLSDAFAYVDPYTAGHEKRVAKIAVEIAKKLKVPSDEIDALKVASLLHDIGKIYVPNSILSKPTKLTENEFNLIKEHPQIGSEIVFKIDFPWDISKIILDHHERLNGSGYPNGLVDHEISYLAKILAVADVVEAISSHRPYRPAFSLEFAIEEIKKGSGILYDEKIVNACIEVLEENKI